MIARDVPHYLLFLLLMPLLALVWIASIVGYCIIRTYRRRAP